jgi:hypothetical protein
MQNFQDGQSPCVLSCTGYGGTGSSAATDIFREFKTVKNFGENEYSFLHEPDGLSDLESAFCEGHRLKIDLSVKRFIALHKKLSNDNEYKTAFNGKFYKHTEDFIASLGIVKWKGYWHRINEIPQNAESAYKTRLSSGLFFSLLSNKKYFLHESDDEKWRPTYLKKYDMYYYNTFENSSRELFYKSAKIFTANLINKALNNNEKEYTHIILDQILPPSNLQKYSKYFYNIKSIIIDRDPRDLFVIDKAEWGIGLFPTDTVDNFIKWYRLTRMCRTNDLLNTDLCLLLNLESLVYEYDKSLEKLYNFSNLNKNKHTHKLSCFNPDVSIINTQLYKKYPKYFSDVKKIEKELEEYCYDFPPNKIHIDTVHSDYVYISDVYKAIDDFWSKPLTFSGFFTRIKLVFFSTTTGKNYYRMKERSGFRKIKSIIKIILSFVFLPFEMIIYFILSFLN